MNEHSDRLDEILTPPFNEAAFLSHLGDPVRMAPFIDIFFAERGYFALELPTGQGFVVKRP